eukprot:SAG22_NODE_216_length_14937_cov_51.622995_6_plen_82_part_00
MPNLGLHSSSSSSSLARTGNKTRRMNHSERPNVSATVVNHRGVRKVCMYARRRVDRGEEHCIDYGPHFFTTHTRRDLVISS